jgi:hypothetical protein
MSSPARARSVALPIATLGELLAHDFEIHVWCPRCHEFRRPTIPAERLRHKFAGARFRCRCGAPHYPSFRPGPHTREETERHDHRPVLPALLAALGDARCSAPSTAVVERDVGQGPDIRLCGLPSPDPDAHMEGTACRRAFRPLGAFVAEDGTEVLATRRLVVLVISAQPSSVRIAELGSRR